jgi:putative ABC transport system substrate-binding protein
MDRRTFIGGVAGGVLVPLGSFAQPSGKVWRIGILDYGSAESDYWKAFRERMRELGYVEGRNLAIEARSASGNQATLASEAAELVKLKVDLIATRGTTATLAARAATREIPIVMGTGADPVLIGLVSSLAHPGGNVTGVVSISDELGVKLIELLKILVPRASRVGILLDATNPPSLNVAKSIQKAAESLGMTTVTHGVRNPTEYEAAFDGLRREGSDALVIIVSPVVFTARARLAELALKYRLPTIIGAREYVDAGGLASYGTDYPDLFRRAAEFADKIFKGAKPGDLPVEQPTKFELIINLKTAKALGLTIPQSVPFESESPCMQGRATSIQCRLASIADRPLSTTVNGRRGSTTA